MNNEQATQVFRNYIKGKRVIFVGPAANLMNRGLGSLIDSYDVVVRTNGSKVLDRSLWKDYGCRTHICYFNVQHLREEHPFPIEDMKAHRIDHLVFKGVSKGIRDYYETYFNVRDVAPLIQELHRKIDGLLMGPILITDLLESKPSELFVTGIDCYITKPDAFIPDDYREYYPKYLGNKIETKANVANIGRIDPHLKKKDNTIYIKQLIDSKQITTHDFVLESIKKALMR